MNQSVDVLSWVSCKRMDKHLSLLYRVSRTSVDIRQVTSVNIYSLYSESLVFVRINDVTLKKIFDK